MAETKKIIFDGYTRRLDVFAADELPNLSRALVQKMIKEGHITVNGKVVKPSWPLTRGETVEITLPQAHSQTPLKDLLLHDAKDFFVVVLGSQKLYRLGSSVHHVWQFLTVQIQHECASRC